MARTSGTTLELLVYANQEMTAFVGKIAVTIASGINDLDIVGASCNSVGSNTRYLTSTVDNIYIWNNVTSLTSRPKANLPSGTIFVNRDTSKSEILNNSEWYPMFGSGGWKELGRSASATPSVTNLPNRRYYMVLAHSIAGTSSPQTAFRFNNITSGSYATRYSNDGGADNSSPSGTSIISSDSYGSNEGFNIGYIANFPTKEKLMMSWNCHRNTAGSGTAPRRWEQCSKWDGNTSAINRIDLFNSNSGSFSSSTELVVLGYDPNDPHTENFWQELSNVTLGAVGDNLSTGTFAAKKYLWVQYYKKRSGDCIGLMTFNNDTNTNYAHRLSDGGAGDSTSATRANIEVATSASYDEYASLFIVNVSSREKLVIGWVVGQNTAGAANVPLRREFVGKWTNTSDQITEIDFTNVQAGDFDVGSMIRVWGHD